MRDAEIKIQEMVETNMNLKEYVILQVLGKVALIYSNVRFLC